MVALSAVVDNVTDMLRRTGDTTLATPIKQEVQNAIRHYSRRNSWVIERRGSEITLVADQAWYSIIDNTTGNGIEASPAGTTPTATDDTLEVLSIIYAKLELGAIDWPMDLVTYRTFESLLENNNVSGTPRYITHFAGQIGVWPKPNVAFTLYLSITAKPAVPSADADESVWITQYRELIENSAARRTAFKWLQDPDLGKGFALAEAEQEQLLLAEGAVRTTTGRTTPTWM